MAEASISDRRFTYTHERKWPSEAIDVHHIAVRRSNSKSLFACISSLLVLLNGFYLFFVKNKSIGVIASNIIISAVFMKLMFRKAVVKESVVVMPAFGVQLETHYASGRIIRRFVPIGKILKPVLLECVTPITCYWSLSLILCGEAELMLIFKELRPPVKMLVPIWKALCAASGESLEKSLNMVNDFQGV